MIQQADIEKVREATDIVNVVSDYVTLKKAGANMRGLSPWTSEKTPSFYVSGPKQIFKDFSSGRGGDAFRFVMEMENCSFPDAVKQLAARAAIPITLPEYAPEAVDPIITLNELVLQVYRNDLQRSRPALDYLHGRGVTDEAIEKWQIGLCLGNISLADDGLATYDEMAEAGLLPFKDGVHKDPFVGRIMFPIRDITGSVRGFAGRTFLPRDTGEGSKRPKYYNTEETRCFHKGNMWYGLYENKRDIRQSGIAIVMEGQIDVVVSWVNGVRNAVCSMGTSMTDKQAMSLSAITGAAGILADGDVAGKRAAIKMIPTFLAAGIETVKIADLPNKEDPASLGTNLHAYITKLDGWQRYFISMYKAHKKAEDKAAIRGKVTEILSSVKDADLRRELLEELSAGMGISHVKIAPAPVKRPTKEPEDPHASAYDSPEFVLMHLAVSTEDPDLLPFTDSMLQIDGEEVCFCDPGLQFIRDKIRLGDIQSLASGPSVNGSLEYYAAMCCMEPTLPPTKDYLDYLRSLCRDIKMNYIQNKINTVRDAQDIDPKTAYQMVEALQALSQ